MSQLINLKGTDLAVIEVPEDAHDFDFYNSWRKELRYLLKGHINPFTAEEQYGMIPLEEFSTLDKLEILGTIDAKTISFDVEEYLRRIYLMSGDKSFVGFADYQDEEKFFPYSDLSCKDKSMYSLLAANGLYWVNPLGIEKPESKPVLTGDELDDPLLNWFLYENEKLTGKLIVIKLLK